MGPTTSQTLNFTMNFLALPYQLHSNTVTVYEYDFWVIFQLISLPYFPCFPFFAERSLYL